MKQTPMDKIMQSAIAQRGEKGMENLRPITGFSGYYLAISLKPFKWKVSMEMTLQSDHCITVITTSRQRHPHLLKPYRKKHKDTKSHDYWVQLVDDEGRKKNFSLEKLADLVFGERWATLKEDIKDNQIKNILKEQF